MNVNVIYQSRGGNTKKLAQAIAAAAGVSPEPTEKGLRGNTDLLFVGGALYAGGLDKSLQRFLEGLSQENVKRAVLFGTAASDKNIGEQALPVLEARGIEVIGEFYCKGKFLLMNRKHPDEQDLKNGSSFARDMISKASRQPSEVVIPHDGSNGNMQS